MGNRTSQLNLSNVLIFGDNELKINEDLKKKFSQDTNENGYREETIHNAKFICLYISKKIPFNYGVTEKLFEISLKIKKENSTKLISKLWKNKEMEDALLSEEKNNSEILKIFKQ
jgi:hypothetical protein